MQPGTKRSISSSNETSMQAGESSKSFKRPRTGNSPILDGVYKGGNKPFKKSVENNLETPNSCKPDGPFKTNFLENIDFHIPSHIKVRCLGIDLKIPTINAPGLEINSLISCLIDLPINYHEILYLSVILIIKVIVYLINYDPT